jgi:predicted ArsR family transcriptional regulator
MTTVFPHQPPVDHTPRERADVVICSDDHPNTVQTLASETAQDILTTLRDEPATATDVAEAVNTSVQNAQYHIERLVRAEFIEPVDTWYSAKGKEMTVYALSAEELVIQFGSTN